MNKENPEGNKSSIEESTRRDEKVSR